MLIAPMPDNPKVQLDPSAATAAAKRVINLAGIIRRQLPRLPSDSCCRIGRVSPLPHPPALLEYWVESLRAARDMRTTVPPSQQWVFAGIGGPEGFGIGQGTFPSAHEFAGDIARLLDETLTAMLINSRFYDRIEASFDWNVGASTIPERLSTVFRRFWRWRKRRLQYRWLVIRLAEAVNLVDDLAIATRLDCENGILLRLWRQPAPDHQDAVLAPSHRSTETENGKLIGVEAPPSVSASAFAPAVCVNSLIRENKIWSICFAGKTKSLPDRTGLRYIQKLLAHPGKPIEVSALLGRAPSPTLSSQPVLDDKAKAAAEREYHEAQKELDDARELGNQQRVEKAQERLANLAECVGDPSSKSASRDMSNDQDNVRCAVAVAIARALDVIEQAHPEAHQHLKESLVSPAGKAPTYRPAVGTLWFVNLTESQSLGGLPS